MSFETTVNACVPFRAGHDVSYEVPFRVDEGLGGGNLSSAEPLELRGLRVVETYVDTKRTGVSIGLDTWPSTGLSRFGLVPLSRAVIPAGREVNVVFRVRPVAPTGKMSQIQLTVRKDGRETTAVSPSSLLVAGTCS